MTLVSYDFDGVLAEQPPPSTKSWGKMNGDERRARKLQLVEWYKNASPLYTPIEEKFYVLSARKAEQYILQTSLDWLNSHYKGRVISLYLLNKSRSVINAAEFKSNCIIDLNITKHIEDNKKVLKVMRGLLPITVNLYFWQKGMKEPIPYES